MVAYSFNPRFVEPILSGAKCQTLRGPRRRHATPGDELQLYTGQRTQHCRLLGTAACVEASDVTISFDGDFIAAISLGDALYPRALSATEMEWFARGDGFADLAAMSAWWRAAKPGQQTIGLVRIRWAGFEPARHGKGGAGR